MSLPTTPSEIPIPHSPTTSSLSDQPSSSFTDDTEDTKLSQPAPLPILNLQTLIYQNSLLLSRLASSASSEITHIRSLTAELKAHNDAIAARRRTSAQLTLQRKEYKTAGRLFNDAKLNELVCRLLLAKNIMAVVGQEDEGDRERRGREMDQVRELRDVVRELQVWDRTVLGARMRELGGEGRSAGDMRVME
ncbi:MAG: hypothetical protein LQ338_003413 [Usnochroma carphineum]|nr:MAG: hypothetical protein LQ338_003413 [Usnochroma carphineum]